MSINRCYEIAEKWTDAELRQQLDFVLDEYRTIPRPLRTDRNREFSRVVDWYKAVCNEYRRRDKEPELIQLVNAWKEKR